MHHGKGAESMLLGDLREYVTIPRVTALRLAPDGSWLAVVVQTVGGEPPKYVSSILADRHGGGSRARPAHPRR